MQTIGLPEIKIKKPWVPRSFKKVEIDRGVLRLACRHAVVYGIYKAAEKYGINRETFRNNFKKRYPLIYKNKGNLNFVTETLFLLDFAKLKTESSRKDFSQPWEAEIILRQRKKLLKNTRRGTLPSLVNFLHTTARRLNEKF